MATERAAADLDEKKGSDSDDVPGEKYDHSSGPVMEGAPKLGLVKELKGRHMQMIAIGTHL